MLHHLFRKVLYPVTSRTYFSMKSNHEYSEDFLSSYSLKFEVFIFVYTSLVFTLSIPVLVYILLVYEEPACRFFFIIDHLCPSDYFVSNETTVTWAVAPDTGGKNVTLLSNKACR